MLAGSLCRVLERVGPLLRQAGLALAPAGQPGGVEAAAAPPSAVDEVCQLLLQVSPHGRAPAGGLASAPSACGLRHNTARCVCLCR